MQLVTVNEVCFVSSKHSFSEPSQNPLVIYLLRNMAFPFLISAGCLCFTNYISKVLSGKYSIICGTANEICDHFWLCIPFLTDMST